MARGVSYPLERKALPFRIGKRLRPQVAEPGAPDASSLSSAAPRRLDRACRERPSLERVEDVQGGENVRSLRK